MKNLFYIVAAYSLLWIVLFGYLLNLLKKQATLEKELKKIQAKIDQNN